MYILAFPSSLSHVYSGSRSYIDTVGNPEAYRNKLDRVFQSHFIEFIVEKKADAKYATCSAASVGTFINHRLLPLDK